MDLNTEEFSYDGGDCCAATCNHPLCGLGTIDSHVFETNISSVWDGYQGCSDPSMETIEIILNPIYLSHDQSNALLQVDCGGKSHLVLNVEKEMVNKREKI